MQTKKTKKKGFTIVELVIVIAIVAVLAAVLIPTFSSLIKKANDSAYLQDRTNQMIADLAEKVTNQDYLSWEDFEATLAQKLSGINTAGGLTDAQVQQAIAGALAEYQAKLNQGNTGLTEEQVQAIIQHSLSGSLTTSQVQSIVDSAINNLVAGLPSNTLTPADIDKIINDTIKELESDAGQAGITPEQMQDAINNAINSAIQTLPENPGISGEELNAAIDNAINNALSNLGGNDEGLTEEEIKEIINNALSQVNPDSETPENPTVYSVTVSQSNYSFTVGGAPELLPTATLTKNGQVFVEAYFSWSSSNTSVASIINGYIVPRNAGTATITVTSVPGAATATITVVVNPISVPVVTVDSVSLTPVTLPLSVGQIGNLTATVNPENATNKTLYWESSNPNVAIVYNNGTVLGVSEGTAVITVYAAADSTKYASCTVTVTGTGSVTPPATSATGISISTDNLVVYIGATRVLTATVEGDNNAEVIWTSNNPGCAYVYEVDGQVNVCGITAGTATITATVRETNISDTCTVIVLNSSYPGGITPVPPTDDPIIPDTPNTSETETPESSEPETPNTEPSVNPETPVDPENPTDPDDPNNPEGGDQGGTETPDEPTVSIEGAKINFTTLTLNTNAEHPALTVSNISTNEPLVATWSSSDTSVVTVAEDGKITTGANPGNAYITATVTVGGEQATYRCVVIVNSHIHNMSSVGIHIAETWHEGKCTTCGGEVTNDPHHYVDGKCSCGREDQSKKTCTNNAHTKRVSAILKADNTNQHGSHQLTCDECHITFTEGHRIPSGGNCSVCNFHVHNYTDYEDKGNGYHVAVCRYSNCAYYITETHNYEYTADAYKHVGNCRDCNAYVTSEHTKPCNDCGYSFCVHYDNRDNDYKWEISADKTKHYIICTGCNGRKMSTEEEHVFGDDKICDLCNYNSDTSAKCEHTNIDATTHQCSSCKKYVVETWDQLYKGWFNSINSGVREFILMGDITTATTASVMYSSATIDLNGHTFTIKAQLKIYTNVSIEFVDTSTEKTGKIAGSGNFACNSTNKAFNLTLDGVTVEKTSGNLVVATGNAVITISNSTVKCQGAYIIAGLNNANVTLTIESSNFTYDSGKCVVFSGTSNSSASGSITVKSSTANNKAFSRSDMMNINEADGHITVSIQ